MGKELGSKKEKLTSERDYSANQIDMKDK